MARSKSQQIPWHREANKPERGSQEERQCKSAAIREFIANRVRVEGVYDDNVYVAYGSSKRAAKAELDRLIGVARSRAASVTGKIELTEAQRIAQKRGSQASAVARR